MRRINISGRHRERQGQLKLIILGLLGLFLITLAGCGEMITPTVAPSGKATPTTTVTQDTPGAVATFTPGPAQTTIAPIVKPEPTATPGPTAGETPRSSAAQDAQQAEAVITKYFTAINDRNYQAAFTLLSDRYRKQLTSQSDFAKTFSDTLASVKVNTLNQENVVGSGENWLVYKVQLQVKVGSTPSNFNNGNNLEWIKLVRTGQGWLLDDFATSPISQ